MAFLLEIMSGERKGARFKVRAGIQIGRKHGDIILRDSKLSKLHAKIEEDESGDLFVVDQNSANGIRVKGRRVTKVRVQLGAIFQVGKTIIRVVTEHKTAPDGPEAILVHDEWNDRLAKLATSSAEKNLREPSPTFAFLPALRLTVIQGIQSETEWTLGYGPRSIGAHSLEFPVFEKGCPEECFRISTQGPGSFFFETEHPHLVKLNDQSTKAEKITEGDIISIGLTKIQISYITNEADS